MDNEGKGVKKSETPSKMQKICAAGDESDWTSRHLHVQSSKGNIRAVCEILQVNNKDTWITSGVVLLSLL